MKVQQSEDVAASVSDDKMDAKDMKQSASSNDNEQTEVEEEKSHGLRSVGNESIYGKHAKIQDAHIYNNV